MSSLKVLLDNNRSWAEAQKRAQPNFFARTAGGQSPKYLWIGCADSRVVPNQILGLASGELFVHRNIANVVSHKDDSCLAVLQYAVEVLKVEHIIVAGHYGCGGVAAALANWQARCEDDTQPVGRWLGHIALVCRAQQSRLSALPNDEQRARCLSEQNAIAQAKSAEESAIVRRAKAGGQKLQVHAWIYELQDGLLRDLHE